MDNQLSPEDQARVERYLQGSANHGERKPFRPWLLLGSIWLIMVAFGLISYIIAWKMGVI